MSGKRHLGKYGEFYNNNNLIQRGTNARLLRQENKMEIDSGLLKELYKNAMKNTINIISIAISSFFILLFVYASVSKLSDFEMFQVQLAQSPIFGSYSNLISYLTIGSELLIVLLLFLKKFRLFGLYASLGLMSAFTIYIYLILTYSDSIPCSCGGVLENMDWDTHLIFNVSCVILAIIAIFSSTSKSIKITAGYTALFIVFPMLSVVILFYLQKNDNQGTFTRKILTLLAEEKQTLQLPANNYYFAGHHGDSLFLANHKTPLLISTIVPDFKSVKVDTIRLGHYNYKFVSVTINVLYPYFSVSDGKVPVIFEGKMPSFMAYDTGINRLYFSRLYMLAPQQYVFKTMLVKTKQSELGILNTASKKYHINENVLQAKSDGVFDTDGNIAIDRENKGIFYTQLYRSEITSTDFNLENIQRKHTIDSLSTSAIETKTLKNGQTKLLRSPSEINRIQSITHGKLYNVSKIRAKNESYKDFRKNDIIDVYDVSTKKYWYSFYIKNEERIKIRGILATKHYLYVLSGNNITRYSFK